MISCEHAQTSLGLDTQGRSWEHFWLGDRYQFSNQIPNLKSFTRTDPGWVLADNNYCTWQGIPPARLRETTPTVTQPLAAEANAIAPMSADAGMASGGFGVLVLVAAAVGGVMWWRSRDKVPDPNYHPMADMPYQLPALRVAGADHPDELEWQEGDPIPEGYELIEEDEGEAAEDEDPKFEASPFLPRALRQIVRAEAEAAARNQSHSSFMAGLDLADRMQRVYPRSQRPQPGAYITPERAIPPAVELVGSTGGQLVRETGRQPVKPELRPDPREVELFEENVKAFTPLPLTGAAGETQEAIREALRLGKSQNWMTANLFQVSKGTKAYEQAVTIIKALQEDLP